MSVTVIGPGRWGTFLAWYSSRIFKNVTLYGRQTSEKFQNLLNNRKNEYLTLNDNIEMSSNLEDALKSDFIIISVGAQTLRILAKEINSYDVSGKTFILCMKGIEASTGKRLSQVIKEEINQNIKTAVWLGPGHVQEFVKDIPNCMVIDSEDDSTIDNVINTFDSDLIRFYYGQDIVGTEIGGATKNVIGIAAGVLDGLGFPSLKGALMARGTREVSRFIEGMGGNALSAYGLAHLGDYEATLFSEHSHNRRYGENMVKGEKMLKLAEGVETVRAVYAMAQKHKIPMPITEALYNIIFEKSDVKETFSNLFHRETKPEFLTNKEYKEE